MGSVVKKRRKKISKHKHRKMLKKTRWQRRHIVAAPHSYGRAAVRAGAGESMKLPVYDPAKTVHRVECTTLPGCIPGQERPNHRTSVSIVGGSRRAVKLARQLQSETRRA